MSRAFFEGSSSPGRPQHVSAILSDDMLLQICRASVEETQAKPQWMEDLRSVPLLARRSGHGSNLELAVTMLASLLGQLPRHCPEHLPFGFGGPRCQSLHWIDYDTLDGVSKQIVGLVEHHREPASVAADVEQAISESIRLGFLDQKSYDAWRPGMPSGSGWRIAVMATPYGITKARASCPDVSRTERIGIAPVGGGDNAFEPPPAEHAPPDYQSIVDVPSPDGSPPCSVCSFGADPDHRCVSDSAADQPYAWARQIELVNATNQVLGDGMLNKGVLSRACRTNRIATNGRPGQASRVSVADFLAWIVRQFSIAREEQIQIRNAIIGEINARNSCPR